MAKQKDWQAYNRLLSQDFVGVDDSGVLLGQGPFLKYIAGLDLTDYAMEGVNVTMFRNNMAMLTYKVTHHGKFAGQTIPQPHSMSVRHTFGACEMQARAIPVAEIIASAVR